MLINEVGWYAILFNFYAKLAESSFLCRFRVESVNVLVCAMCFFFPTDNFAHAQTLYRMRSLCRSFECMNIVWVNIACFTGCKRIKQPRISFVLGYLRMILWIISTAISIKHRILATFNVLKKINFDSLYTFENIISNQIFLIFVLAAWVGCSKYWIKLSTG